VEEQTVGVSLSHCIVDNTHFFAVQPEADDHRGKVEDRSHAEQAFTARRLEIADLQANESFSLQWKRCNVLYVEALATESSRDIHNITGYERM